MEEEGNTALYYCKNALLVVIYCSKIARCFTIQYLLKCTDISFKGNRHKNKFLQLQYTVISISVAVYLF